MQPALQRFALEDRHGQEGNAVILIDFMDGDDVVILNRSGQASLAQETFLGLRAGSVLGEHDLESDLAQEPNILGEVDRPHAAVAEFLEDERSS